MKLDTLSLVETPEGTDLHAEVVGLVPRGLAYSLDLLIRIAVITVLGIVLSALGKAGDGLMLIVYFLMEWWYPVLFEVYRNGQTIGKKAFNIKVVNEDFTPIRMGASLTRNLLRTADFFPLFYAVGSLSILFTKRFQRLGDLAANTIVIYHQEEERHDAVELDDVKPITPIMVMNEAQQGAMINFALNRGQLSPARQAEIAAIIQPKLPANVEDPVLYCRGVGKWLLGAR